MVGTQIKTILLLVLMVGITLSALLVNPNHAVSQITSFKPVETPVVLGNTGYGYVERAGPYGNTSSPVKIAYITGVHPLESGAHNAITEALLTNEKSLRYCYYIYRVHVTQDPADYTKGRINGQKLAYRYVVPDVESMGFNLVVDVHSNRGVYREKIFLDVPVDDVASKKYALEMVHKTPWLTFYIPPPDKGPTSAHYVILPLINHGVPTFVYETYTYQPYTTNLSQDREFVENLDKIDV